MNINTLRISKMATLYKREFVGNFLGIEGVKVFVDVPVPANETPNPMSDFHAYETMRRSQPKRWCYGCQREIYVNELKGGYCGPCSYQKEKFKESSDINEKVKAFKTLKEQTKEFITECEFLGVPPIPVSEDRTISDWNLIKDWPASGKKRCFFCSDIWLDTPCVADKRKGDYCTTCNRMRSLLNMMMKDKTMPKKLYHGMELEACQDLIKNFVKIGTVILYKVICYYMSAICDEDIHYISSLDTRTKSLKKWEKKLDTKDCCQNCEQEYRLLEPDYWDRSWYSFCYLCMDEFVRRNNKLYWEEERAKLGFSTLPPPTVTILPVFTPSVPSFVVKTPTVSTPTVSTPLRGINGSISDVEGQYRIAKEKGPAPGEEDEEDEED